MKRISLHTTRKIFAVTTLLLLLFGCTTTVQQAVVKEARVISDPSRVKPIAITKVAAKIRRGTVVGKYRVGLLCIENDEVKWKSGNKVLLSSEDLVDVFREELEANGWPVVGSTEDLFEGYDVSGAEVLVAARITDMESDFCAPNSGFGNWDLKGSMRMGVEWQVYSPARRKLIGKIDTEGSSEISRAGDDTSFELLANSFSVAVNNLLAEDSFYDLVESSAELALAPDMVGAESVDNERVSFATLQSALDAAKRATVTVRVAQAHGSGFAIGDGRYVLTNSHVVGDAKNVTLVTNSGIELPARVKLVSEARDVALLEVDAIRLPVLHIQPRLPQVGSPVYAVGSPLDERLSGTVTSGVVSGTRILDGQNWLQSDTSINPGNSGGPLVDGQGSVIGISTAGMTSGGSQVGLNLFVPIEEALSFIGLKVD